MRDPYPPCPKFLQNFIRPISDRYGLYTLPLHIHEVLFAFLFYHSINVFFSPMLSKRYFGKYYNSLNRRTKVNWDAHVVALVQSVFISLYSFYSMYADKERQEQHRVFGYTGFGGTVQAFGAGYFLWDLMVSVQYLHIFGPGMLAHSISALIVYSLGFVSIPKKLNDRSIESFDFYSYHS